MANKFLIPATIEAGSVAAQLVRSVAMKNISHSFFIAPKSLDGADIPDLILPTQQSNALIGVEVFDTVTFMGTGPFGSLSYYDLTTQTVITVPKIQIPIALCKVSKMAHIVKTNVAGRNGSVKQYISLGDYDINIKGIFTTGIVDKYPEFAMKQLQAITNCTTEVKVASNFLSMFGINYVVFDSCDFEQQEDTGRDEQSFVLNCTSETPFTINVNQQGGATSNSFNGTVSAAPAPIV